MSKREIKFRAWIKGFNGPRYIGSYDDSEWGSNYAVIDNKHIVYCCVDENGDGDGEDFVDYLEIDCLEQYTGLKDKNGKEIYEGDIVKCNDCVREVFFNQSEASFMFKNDRLADSLSRELFYSSNSEYEIIGNIHENPELLRRKRMND